MRNAFTGFFLHVALAFAPIFLLFGPVRSLLKKLVTAPGEGPDKTAWSKEWIEYKAVATADAEGGKRAFGRVKYNGGMYYCKSFLLSLSQLPLTSSLSPPTHPTQISTPQSSTQLQLTHPLPTTSNRHIPSPSSPLHPKRRISRQRTRWRNLDSGFIRREIH